AIERGVAEDQFVARGLALAPEPVLRAGMEMDDTGLVGDPPRLLVHPREHQDATVRGILDDRRHEAVRSPARLAVGARHGTGHAATSGTRRTASPASAIARLTAAIEWIRRWKIEAARTASAPPSRMAATKSAGPAAPPDAITGTSTRPVIARRRSVS